MSEPFVGQIKMFAGTFAPRGFADCDGQLLAVSQNDALFSLLGTIYGGDGRTTFGLPDLRGRVPIHEGTGPGLSPRNLGSRSGAETATLSTNEMPSHNHVVFATSQVATDTMPSSAQVPAQPSALIYYDETDDPPSFLNSNVISLAGGSQAHNNMAPYLTIRFIIALVGIYPSRE